MCIDELKLEDCSIL